MTIQEEKEKNTLMIVLSFLYFFIFIGAITDIDIISIIYIIISTYLFIKYIIISKIK